MEKKGPISLVLFMLIVVGTLVSPSYAHQKRRYDPSHKPAWRIVAHSHESDSEVQANAKAKAFNPIQGAAWLAGGIYKAVEGTVKAVISPSKDVEQEETTSKRPASHNRTGFRWGQPGRK